jgi:hypothetical protein
MYTVRTFAAEGHTETEYASVDEAFGSVYGDPLPNPTSLKDPLIQNFAIYLDGVCMHFIRDGMSIGDPL